MRKIMLVLFSAIMLLCGCTVLSEENGFPNKEIKDIEVVELYPNYSMTFDDYVKKDLQNMREYDWWSTFHPSNLTKFNLTTFSSSTLNNSDSYKSDNLCDGKLETAWVEGSKGDGINEWAKINFDAYSSRSEFTSTPFSIFEIAVLPGYSKSLKTWTENNRVKKLLVVIYSPQPSFHQKNEWAVFRLYLNDEDSLQVFKLPHSKISTNYLDGLKKEIWIKVEDIYKGSKYDDTCISEFVAVGGFTN